MRSQVKDIFCHPRCVYCVDKLNRYADISVGDNYTQESAYPMGSSRMIVRSEGGMKTYEAIKNGCVANDTTIEKIADSQEISKKLENFYFAGYKYGDEKIPSMKLNVKYHYKLLKILMGKKFYSNKYIMKICIKLDTLYKL